MTQTHTRAGRKSGGRRRSRRRRQQRRWRWRRRRRTRKRLTNLISPPNHALLTFHLNVLLLLGVRQRPRHAEQEGARAEDPQRLAAEAQRRPRERGQRRGGVADAAPRGRRDHVLEGGDALVERLVLDVDARVGGDLGVYIQCQKSWVVSR